MANSSPDQTKALLKEALAELFTEQREAMIHLIQEAMEDRAFASAIEEGLETPAVERDVIFALLNEEAI